MARTPWRTCCYPWPRYSFHRRRCPCISFRSIGHADQPTIPLRRSVFSLWTIVSFHDPPKTFAGHDRLSASTKVQVRSDCLTDRVENVRLTMSPSPTHPFFFSLSIPLSSLSASYSSSSSLLFDATDAQRFFWQRRRKPDRPPLFAVFYLPRASVQLKGKFWPGMLLVGTRSVFLARNSHELDFKIFSDD